MIKKNLGKLADQVADIRIYGAPIGRHGEMTSTETNGRCGNRVRGRRRRQDERKKARLTDCVLDCVMAAASVAGALRSTTAELMLWLVGVAGVLLPATLVLLLPIPLLLPPPAAPPLLLLLLLLPLALLFLLLLGFLALGSRYFCFSANDSCICCSHRVGTMRS